MRELIIAGSAAVTVIGVVGTILHRFSTDVNAKTKRMWTRLDDIKKDHQDHFVSKDVCEVQHISLKEIIKEQKADIQEIKADIKTLLRKNGVE